ncbi:MAG: AMP-binding protein [Bacteroidota bacterium]
MNQESVMVRDQVNRMFQQLAESQGNLVTYRAGQRISIPWPEVRVDVRRACNYLGQQGLVAGDHVAIQAQNGYEWVVFDLATLACGLVTVPLDPAAAYPVAEFRERYDIRFWLTDVPEADGELTRPLGEMLDADPVGVDWTAHVYAPDDPVSFKFTSGSTSGPKAMRALKKSVDAALTHVQGLFHHGPGDTIIVFLPMSTYQMRLWLYSAVVYEHDLLLVPRSLVFYALETEAPTVLMGVPYIYEAIQKMALTAVEDPQDAAAVREEVQRILGGNIRYLWTGSAPISRDLLLFFNANGAPIYQGYGMNEICIATKNYPGHDRPGSAGKALPGKEIAFDAHGQILVRSEHEVANAYFRARPEDDAATFIKPKWVATGDIGHLDADGYLYITGRIKDLIVLSNAAKVHPNLVEKTLLNAPEIRQCMVYGDRKPYLVALIVPTDPAATREAIGEVIRAANRELRPHDRVLRFALVREAFTEEAGLLTSSNKLRRKPIIQLYQENLEALYEQ